MARIGLAHSYPVRGGSEAVCMNVLAALEDDHEVTLLTPVPVELEELNEFYNTNIDTEAVSVRNIGIPGHGRILDRSYLLGVSVFSRLLAGVRDEYDVVVSTHNELCVAPPAVQYVHMPHFLRWVPGVDPVEVGISSSPVHKPYDALCRRIIGFDPDLIRASQLVTNSKWTAEVINNVYGVTPTVVYPPIDGAGLSRDDWDDRENGFVTIGRLDPEKQFLRTIQIIEEVYDAGYDVHLHIVGPEADEQYARRIRDEASEKPFVHLEGRLSRSELVDLICSHRYGINGMETEHFGISVAELAVGGTIPFVPDDGGQREIVKKNELLLYSGIDDAVERITTVLSNPSIQQNLREELCTSTDRFDRARFRDHIHEIVDSACSE